MTNLAMPGRNGEKGVSHVPFMPPQLSPDDLQIFHQNHFSTEAVAHFNLTFFNPSGASQNQSADDVISNDEYYDDDLGYYEDGVKRTLTDEQIAMFRHSEIEALRRQLHKRPVPADHGEGAEIEAGEIEDDMPESSGGDQKVSDPSAKQQQTSINSKNKNKKRKGNKGRQQEPKPDLRKRTWDVVETGLDSLDYD